MFQTTPISANELPSNNSISIAVFRDRGSFGTATLLFEVRLKKKNQKRLKIFFGIFTQKSCMCNAVVSALRPGDW